LLGILTVERGLNTVAAKTGIRVAPVFLPYPEAGVDVDKVEDMLLAESVVAATASVSGVGTDLRDRTP
jgi:hypothetical protein